MKSTSKTKTVMKRSAGRVSNNPKKVKVSEIYHVGDRIRYDGKAGYGTATIIERRKGFTKIGGEGWPEYVIERDGPLKKPVTIQAYEVRGMANPKNLTKKSKGTPYVSDDTVYRAKWDQTNRRNSKLYGYNKAGHVVETLGQVLESGDQWLGIRHDGESKDFAKRPDALAYVSKGHIRKANPKVKKGMKAARKRRCNPESEASEVFELFHGVPSKEVIEYTTRFHVHENLAGLGRLTELVFFTPGAKPEKVTFEEEDLGDGIWLCASEDGKQLYILGEVDVDLEELGYRPDVDVKDAVELGRLTQVVYATQKEFHQLRMLEYDHHLGRRHKWQKDEGVGPELNKAIAECPILAYHPIEKRLSVIGGQYLILAEGITN